MLDAMRDDCELPRAEDELFVFQLQAQPTLHHQKQLIFPVVMMPDELALKLRELHETVVHFAHDLRAPLVLKAAEHVGQIDFADRHSAARRVLVSTTVENSPFRSARATSWSSSDA